jgi:hypothetical protein
VDKKHMLFVRRVSVCGLIIAIRARAGYRGTSVVKML